MRADRLVTLLLLMQARGRVTAAEVASELEVSRATARRDLEALASAGVPVYAQPGRHGGWSLVGGARTDLTGLTVAEVRALFLLAGPAELDPAARSALRKLTRALPEVFRADAEAAASAVVLDSERWGDAPAARPAAVDLLQDAVVRRRRVRFVYREAEREVDPWALVDKGGVWYLLAGTPSGPRTFRIDRLGAPSTLDHAAQRPADLDVDAEWHRVVDEMERRRSVVTATILLPASLYPVLATRHGRHCERLPDAADGRACARVAAHTPLGVAQELAGWGGAVEVLEPASVRDELARLGRELVAAYGPRS